MLQLIEAVERLLSRLGILSGFATLLITLVVVLDVAGRAIFSAPLHMSTEISELLLVVLVFLGLAAAQQNRQNYAIDIASRHLPQGLQLLVEHLGYAFSLVLVGVLAWLSTKQAYSAYERGEAGFGIIPFPIWPARFILAIGLWLLAVQFLCDILRYLMGAPRVAVEGESPGSHE
ncbi:MAG: TRAP transporter small permease [Hyphomicrobiaceae bacterium]|nr:TRAP transporter small permease [Hyphomicrobiaceae bacterium]